MLLQERRIPYVFDAGHEKEIKMLATGYFILFKPILEWVKVNTTCIFKKNCYYYFHNL